MDIITTNSTVYGTEIKSFNDYIYKHSIEINKLWDEEIIDEILSNISDNSDILDIGANIGLITLGVIKKAKEQNKKISNIHCFECDIKHIPLLSSNISYFDYVKLYPFAISNKQEICNITTLESNMGCNYIYSSKDETNNINYDYSTLFNTDCHTKNTNLCVLGVALDSIKYQFSNKISVIKIDVEGYELKVLEGAEELIRLHIPVIIIEIFESINFDKVMEIFKKVEYKSYRKINNKNYSSQDYIFFPN